MILSRATASERKTLRKVLQLEEPKKPRKYGNKTVYADGHKFDSKGEYGHWLKLKAREERGQISDLKVHQVYELRAYPFCAQGNPIKVGKIIPDFDYIENGKQVTADFKGMVTAVWRLRAKLFKANYGREIVVVRR